VPPMFGRAAIRLGIGPHSSCYFTWTICNCTACVACQCVIIDSRSFLEFNTSHIAESINVSSSKLIRRRLQQNKVW